MQYSIMSQGDFANYIVRDACPICNTNVDNCKYGGGEFYICSYCGVYFRKRIFKMLPEVGWETDYYQNTSVLKHHLRRRSGFYKIEKKLFEYLKYRGKILDVGCGIGTFLKIAKDRGWQVEGVEPSPTACKIARKNTESLIYNGDFININFSYSFDAITIIDVLRSVENPASFLKKSYMLLKKGGILLIREIHAAYQKHRRLRSKLHSKSYEYIQEWTPSSLEKAVSSVGFKNISVYPSPVFVDGADSLLRRYTKRIIYPLFVCLHSMTHMVISPTFILIAQK